MSGRADKWYCETCGTPLLMGEERICRKCQEREATPDAYMACFQRIAELEAQVARLTEARNGERTFPIQGGPSVPWRVMEPHDAQAQKNHGGQSLSRLAERGGLCPSEALAVVLGKPWSWIDEISLQEAQRQWWEFADKANNDEATEPEVCEWRKKQSGYYQADHHETDTTQALIPSWRMMEWTHCPYCGKRIQIAEAE